MDFAPNATVRYRLTYVAAGVIHFLTLRYARGTALASVVTTGNSLVTALFTALQPAMPADLEAIAVDAMAADADTWLPFGALPSLPAGAASVAAYKPVQKITSTTFPGKGGGSKARIVVFGFKIDQVAESIALDAKFTAGESALIQDAIDALNADTNLRAINNEPVFWYQRATIKINDRLLRDVRRGIIG